MSVVFWGAERDNLPNFSKTIPTVSGLLLVEMVVMKATVAVPVVRGGGKGGGVSGLEGDFLAGEGLRVGKAGREGIMAFHFF